MRKKIKNQQSNNRLITILSFVTIAMFGFGYALVPVYNVLCKSLGINGKPSNMVSNDSNEVDLTRTITVQFLTTRNNYLPWKFYPLEQTIKVHPGENKKVEFYAENDTNNAMIVQAIPSVTPGLAARYLKKTECFCFSKQTMNGKQNMRWPLLFHIDKDLPKNIHTVTLSYTLFDITKFANTIKPIVVGKIVN